MPGLLRKLFGKPSKKTAAPVKQEYRPPVPSTDKERSADQNYRKRIMEQVTQLTRNAESAGGALIKKNWMMPEDSLKICSGWQEE